MKRIDFFTLERVVQDRLVAASRGGYSPRLVASAPLPLRAAPQHVALGAVSALTLFVLPLVGWGALGSAWGRQPWWLSPVYALACVVLGLLGAWIASRMHARTTAPVAPGLYVFPGVVIEADGSTLCCHALADLNRVAVQQALLTLHYTNNVRLGVVHADVKSALATEQSLREAQQQWSEGRLLAEASDPLTAPKFASPVGPVGAHHRAASFWSGPGWALACGGGVFLSALLWWARNYQSDEAMYAAARAKDTQAAYEAYLVSGVRHAAEVRALDLPRVSATAGASLDMLIQNAKTKGDAAALRSLLAQVGGGHGVALRSPANCAPTPLQPDPCAPLLVASALSEIADKRISTHLSNMPKADSAAIGMWAQILRAATMTGGALRVNVVHARVDSVALSRSDKYLARSTFYVGDVSRLSKHFDDEDEARRDTGDVAELVRALNSKFGPDELRLVAGGSAEPSDVGLLEVRRVSTWSGRVYSSRLPRGVFLGMTYGYELRLQAAGAAQPWARKLTQMVGVDQEWMGGASRDAADTTAKAIADHVYEMQSKLASTKAYAQLLAPLAPLAAP